jgi:hypothetical protein
MRPLRAPPSGDVRPMGSIGRYVFRTTMGAFVITLVSLTIVMWFTQAMREFDLITSERQTLLVFIGISLLKRRLLRTPPRNNDNRGVGSQ